MTTQKTYYVTIYNRYHEDIRTIELKAKTIVGAKREATKYQFGEAYILNIGDELDNGFVVNCLCRKIGKKWIDVYKFGK